MPAEPPEDFPGMLGASVPLESILCTEELQRRPLRPPDYEKEDRALVALVRALADRRAPFYRLWPRRSWRLLSPTPPASAC